MTDQQAQRVQDILTAANVSAAHRSFPNVGHAMHDENPQLYLDTALEWAKTLNA